MNLDISSLRAFVLVAELHSFSKAALRLHRVQSAISQQIQRLEQQIGAPLFVREPRHIKLSKHGAMLLPLALRMLALNDESLVSLRKSPPKGTLRLGTSDTFATCFLPELLTRCAHKFPQLHIDVVCGYSPYLWAEYQKGNLDMVLAQSCPDSIGAELLHAEPLQWVCSCESQVFADDPVPLALFSDGCADRAMAIRALDKVGKCYEIRLNSMSHAAILAAVNSGLVVSALLRSTAQKFVKHRILQTSDGFPALGNVEVVLATQDSFEESASLGFAWVTRDYFASLRAYHTAYAEQKLQTSKPNCGTAALET